LKAIAFLKMAPVVMARKHPFTELEAVVLFCLKIDTDILPGGKKNFHKVRKIPLSNNRTKHSYLHNSEDLLKQLFDKLKKAHLFGIHLNETIDISDKGQLILYCRFADEKTKPLSSITCVV